MQFFTVAVTFFFAGLAAAQGTCFDDGDCILEGGNCVRTGSGIQIVGTCMTSTSAAPGSVPTSGSVCFDAGDCFLSGGDCVKAAGSITGYCVQSSSSSGFPFTA